MPFQYLPKLPLQHLLPDQITLPRIRLQSMSLEETNELWTSPRVRTLDGEINKCREKEPEPVCAGFTIIPLQN